MNNLTENPTKLTEGVYIASVCPSVPESIRKIWTAKAVSEIPIIKDVIFYNTIEELFPKFSEPTFHVDFITIELEMLHNHHSANFFELIKTLKTLISCTMRRNSAGKMSRRNTRIVCLASETTSPSLIRESASLVDYVGLMAGPEPRTWTYEDLRDDGIAFIHGHTGISKKLLQHIKPPKTRTIKINLKENEIHLTPRQRQIYDLIANRGSSNKTIARLLDISESTVKLHTSAILKKYGVKNRTQLAVFSRDREKV